MATFLDAHLIYYAPSGYRAFATNRPFSIQSALVNGTQQYFAAPSKISSANYTSLCNCDTSLEVFYGRRILAIDGETIDAYLTLMASHAGFYLDPGAQLNQYLSASSAFTFQSTAFIAMPADTISILFEGDLVAYTFNNYVTTSRLINGTDLIISLNTPNLTATSKRDFEDAQDAQEVDALLADEEAVLELIRTQQQRSDLSAGHMEVVKRAADRVIANRQAMQVEKEGISANGFRESLAPSVRHQHIMDAWGAYLAAENNVPLDINYLPPSTYSESNRIHVRTDNQFNVNSTVLNVTTGSVDNLYSYLDTPALSYWSYEDTSVLRMKSFAPTSLELINSFVSLMKTASTSRATNGLNKNLIIDVSTNGGGYVCLSYFTLAILVQKWNTPSLTGDLSQLLYSAYDLRQSTYMDDIFNAGFFGPATEEVSLATREPLGPSFYTAPVSRTYGSATSNYTQQFLWNLCPAENFVDAKNSVVFDKILIITDGRCGSACSYFISKLRTADKVRVLSYGGHWGQPMDTSAFSGGNVENWANFLPNLRKEHNITGLPWMTPLPTTGIATFNFREMYNPNDTIPRQFLRMPADYILPYWDPLRAIIANDLNDAASKAALATLYNSALAAFDTMPAGLLGTNSSALLLAVIALICIIVAVTTTIVIIVGCIVNRKNKIALAHFDTPVSDLPGPYGLLSDQGV